MGPGASWQPGARAGCWEWSGPRLSLSPHFLLPAFVALPSFPPPPSSCCPSARWCWAGVWTCTSYFTPLWPSAYR